MSVRGPGSSVGTATELRAGRSGIESPWGRDFPPVQNGPGAHPASCTMGTGSFPGVEAVGAWGWPPNPHLVPKVLEKRRPIPLLTLRACVAYKKDVNLPTYTLCLSACTSSCLSNHLQIQPSHTTPTLIKSVSASSLFIMSLGSACAAVRKSRNKITALSPDVRTSDVRKRTVACLWLLLTAALR